MEKVKRFIARAFGRELDFSTGNSQTMPKWVQNGFYVSVCKICRRDLLKLPRKDKWASKIGVKANFMLCPWCYDKYDIREL